MASADWPVTARLPEWKAVVTKAAIRPYLPFSGQELSAMTHADGPWVEARVGIGESAPSSTVISKESMRLYFERLAGQLDNAAQAL